MATAGLAHEEKHETRKCTDLANKKIEARECTRLGNKEEDQAT
jgi:hypothetical protein